VRLVAFDELPHITRSEVVIVCAQRLGDFPHTLMLEVSAISLLRTLPIHRLTVRIAYFHEAKCVVDILRLPGEEAFYGYRYADRDLMVYSRQKGPALRGKFSLTPDQ
jgi:hypothetical protein